MNSLDTYLTQTIVGATQRYRLGVPTRARGVPLIEAAPPARRGWFGWRAKWSGSPRRSARAPLIALGVIVDQGGKLFFKIVQGRAAHAVPATAAEVVELASRAMHALSLNAPGIDTQTLSHMVRRSGQC